MRQIKFRCWDGETMWLPETKTVDGNNTTLHFFNPDFGIKWGLYDSRLENRVVSGGYDESVLMQLTGMRDKNKNEIYEGDLVQREDRVYEIQWGKWCWVKRLQRNSLTLCFDIIEARDYEVIGNIYEHPELIPE